MRISDWSSDVCSSDLFNTKPTRDQSRRGSSMLQGACDHHALDIRGAFVDLADADIAIDLGNAEFFEIAVAAERLDRAGHHRLGRLRCDQLGHRCRSEEHTAEFQSLMRISYAVFCLKKKHRQRTRTNILNNYPHHVNIPTIQSIP